MYKIHNKLNTKHKKIFKIALISLFLIIIFSISLNNYNYNNKNLAEVLNDPPGYDFYDTRSYYFIHNDKIYYYVLDDNSSFTELSDKLFVMNLDGTGNKKLAETDELRYATFYFVYNNEAYYYTTYYKENKKINLSTGEITSLGNDDIYISKTLSNGEVNTFIDHAVTGNAYSIFKKVDLTTNKTIYEFDLTNDKFNLVLSDIKNEPEYVFNINNKLIFTENTDNLKYYTSNDNLGSVVIYDVSSKNIEKIDGIRKVSFDENYMYLLMNSTENYVVQKYELNS